MTEKNTASASAKAKPGATPAEQIYAAFAESAELMIKASADAALKAYDTAISVTREPAATAMKTGGIAMKDYDEAVAFGRDNIDAMAEASTLAFRGLQDAGREWVGYVQKSTDEVPSAVKALAACKTVKEAAELQADFARSSLESFVGAATKFQQLSLKALSSSVEPLNKRVSETVSKYGKPFAA